MAPGPSCSGTDHAPPARGGGAPAGTAERLSARRELAVPARSAGCLCGRYRQDHRHGRWQGEPGKAGPGARAESGLLLRLPDRFARPDAEQRHGRRRGGTRDGSGAVRRIPECVPPVRADLSAGHAQRLARGDAGPARRRRPRAALCRCARGVARLSRARQSRSALRADRAQPGIGIAQAAPGRGDRRQAGRSGACSRRSCLAPRCWCRRARTWAAI